MTHSSIDHFIARWTSREGGAERANFQMFLRELCAVIGVEPPEPAGSDSRLNDYVFERAVRQRDSEALQVPRRIDLYKRNAFILEAKQSRLPGGRKAIPGQLTLPGHEPERLDRRDAARGWDTMMRNARQQAESYVFLLDADHPAPPFIILCDVGHCLELYADFTGTGRAYSHFPDRKGFRIHLDDLRQPEIRERLRKVWDEPHTLDPSREAARVTRDIAGRLAGVSKALEERGCKAEDVAHFLMRCLFTMFAEDMELLPADSFRGLLERSVKDLSHFPHRLKTLWQQMEKGEEFSHVVEARIRRFNGGLFSDSTVFELGREEIGELLAAASHSWTEVDPAIFGTLLEQALDTTERKRLGAHYTPRAYVQRLVEVTVMEPLREDWQKALRKAEHAKDTGDEAAAVAAVRAFHGQLAATRVLDPACGTGNFLYVSLELMKKLEGEVLETLAQLGETERMQFEQESVDPRQFLGLEINPRAAAIAELVIWIGYLQQHYRTLKAHPSEPILRAFQNINFGTRRGYDAVLTWDGYPVPGVAERDGQRIETYPNARRPEWPEAEFIVGNPPFIGNKRMLDRLGEHYVHALRTSQPRVPGSVDLVMYWLWHSTELLKRNRIRRFGLVTTNSIVQPLNRKPIEHLLDADTGPASITYCVPDHPWISPAEGASVRVSMLVAELGIKDGKLVEIETGHSKRKNNAVVGYVERQGRINSSLSLGLDVTDAKPLLSNRAISHQGVIPVGEGFRLSSAERDYLVQKDAKYSLVLKPYLNGRDLTAIPQERHIIDLNQYTQDEARSRFPTVYQLVMERVKPERDNNSDAKFRTQWWKFGRSRPEIADLNQAISRYIATCRTARHRVFTFLDTAIVPDAKIIYIGLDSGFHLAILSSYIHSVWASKAGAWLGAGNDSTYNHSKVFEPFPFPASHHVSQRELAAVAEELDAFRKARQAEHPKLTLTQMYNVLEKLKAMDVARRSIPSPLWGGSGRGSDRGGGVGSGPMKDSVHTPIPNPSPQGGREQVAPLTPDEERIKDQGLIFILKELHERLDRLVFQAYGWPETLTDEEILERLVALNAERAREEAAGHVRWLRPEYQIPRFAKEAPASRTGELDLAANVVAIDRALPDFPRDRNEDTLAVEGALLAANRPLDAAAIARGFKRGGKRIEPRVAAALNTLVRYGRISATLDGRYLARRAA